MLLRSPYSISTFPVALESRYKTREWNNLSHVVAIFFLV
jgi:hypothetical protein